MYPVNEVGRGIRSDKVGFTMALAPYVAPTINAVTTIRLADGVALTVDWDPVTLEQARGFFSYTVTIESTCDSNGQSDSRTVTVPSNQTSHTEVGLDPTLQYGVTVGVTVNSANGETIIGPTDPDCKYMHTILH